MNDPEIRAQVRSATRRRRVQMPAACGVCGTGAHLRRLPDGRVLCYQDLRVERGAVKTEDDHLAGRQNLAGITVSLLANDHRTITELRLRLGVDDWPPADGDPLKALAHLLAGVATLLVLVGEWLLDRAGCHGEVAVGRPFPVVG